MRAKNDSGFHCVKKARRKPAARKEANGTSMLILEPRGVANKMTIPTAPPIQKEKRNQASAAGPTRSESAKKSGVSASPIARPREAKCRSAKKAANTAAMRSVERKSAYEEADMKPKNEAKATKSHRAVGGSIW